MAIQNICVDGNIAFYLLCPCFVRPLLLLPSSDRTRSATHLYQDFKWDVVATLPFGNFEIPEQAVLDWLKRRLEIDGDE